MVFPTFNNRLTSLSIYVFIYDEKFVSKKEGHYYSYEYSSYSGSSSSEYDYEERWGMKYDIQTGLAFQFGVGVKFADKFSIGLHYYALGKVKLEGEAYEEWYDSDDGEEFYDEPFKLKSVSPSIFAIRLGFHF